MQIRSSNYFLRSVAKNTFINSKITEYNQSAGEWDEKTYEFKKNILETSGFYKKYFGNNENDQINLSDINILNIKVFFKRVISKICMIIGYPVLMIFSIYIYVREFRRQKKYAREALKTIDYKHIFENMKLTKKEFYTKIVFGKIILYKNYFLGYLYERCGGIFITAFIKWLILPIIISFQFFEIGILLSIIPFGLIFLTTKSIFSIFDVNEKKKQKNNLIEIIN